MERVAAKPAPRHVADRGASGQVIQAREGRVQEPCRRARALLNDVKPTDPIVFAATAIAVIAVATMASYLPARTASRVDPIVVLRE